MKSRRTSKSCKMNFLGLTVIVVLGAIVEVSLASDEEHQRNYLAPPKVLGGLAKQTFKQLDSASAGDFLPSVHPQQLAQGLQQIPNQIQQIPNHIIPALLNNHGSRGMLGGYQGNMGLPYMPQRQSQFHMPGQQVLQRYQPTGANFQYSPHDAQLQNFALPSGTGKVTVSSYSY